MNTYTSWVDRDMGSKSNWSATYRQLVTEHGLAEAVKLITPPGWVPEPHRPMRQVLAALQVFLEANGITTSGRDRQPPPYDATDGSYAPGHYMFSAGHLPSLGLGIYKREHKPHSLKWYRTRVDQAVDRQCRPLTLSIYADQHPYYVGDVWSAKISLGNFLVWEIANGIGTNKQCVQIVPYDAPDSFDRMLEFVSDWVWNH